mgnify:CR=1 FL=1
MKKLITTLGLAMFLAMTGTSSFAQTTFWAEFDGAQDGTPSPHTGFGVFVLNAEETQLSYDITFTGLLGTETGAHFHRGAFGVNGPVVHGLALGSPKIGVWNLSASNVADLKAHLLYVNIHSNLYPAGEIRGQVVPEPGSLAALGAGLMGLAGAVIRRR